MIMCNVLNIHNEAIENICFVNTCPAVVFLDLPKLFTYLLMIFFQNWRNSKHSEYYM